MRRYHKLSRRVLEVRAAAIRDRLWKVIRDEPEEPCRRVCVFCGGEVEGLLVTGKGLGTGQEYVRCVNGHYLTGHDWRIEKNEG